MKVDRGGHSLSLVLISACALLAALWPLSAYAVHPAVLPAGMAAAAAAVLVGWRPEFGIALGLALIPLSGIGVGGVRPVRMAVALLAFGTLGYGLLVVRGERARLPAIAAALLLFASVAALSALQGLDPGNSAGKVATVLIAAALFLGVHHVCRERRQLLVVVGGAVAGLALAAGQGLVQQALGEFSEAGILFEGEAVGRVAGSFGHPNQFAGYVAVILPLAAVLAWSRGLPVVLRALGAVATALAVPALMLSYTRGAVAGVVIGSLAWLAISRPRAVLGVGVVMAVAVATLAPAAFQDRLRSTETGEVTLRTDLWGAALDIAGERPLLGVGMGNFDQAYASLPAVLANASQRRLLHKQQVLIPPHANNLYLNTLAEQGVLGLAALGLLGLAALGVAYRASRLADPAGRALGLGLGAGLATFALHQLVEVNLLDLISPLMALLAAACVFLAHEGRVRSGRKP